MAKRHSIQQLDHIMKSDPQRGLHIVQQRAERRIASSNPSERLAGRLTANAVEQAKTRLRNQKNS